MSKKRPTAPAAHHQPEVAGYLVVAAVSACFGATICWLVMRGAPAPPPRAAPPAPMTQQHATAEPSPAPGLSPAQNEAMLGNWNYDRRNWTHAIEHYEKAMALGLDNADVRTDLGSCYRFSGQPEKARALYDSAHRLDPRHENSLFNNATLHADELRDPARAKVLFEQFLARFPESSNAANVRAALSRMSAPVLP